MEKIPIIEDLNFDVDVHESYNENDELIHEYEISIYFKGFSNNGMINFNLSEKEFNDFKNKINNC